MFSKGEKKLWKTFSDTNSPQQNEKKERRNVIEKVMVGKTRNFFFPNYFNKNKS
jgi:hypothetical protein